MRKILVTVTEGAEITTDYQHFAGSACLAESEHFHRLLTQFGIQMENSHKTAKPELLAALSTEQAALSMQEQSSQEHHLVGREE